MVDIVQNNIVFKAMASFLNIGIFLSQLVLCIALVCSMAYAILIALAFDYRRRRFVRPGDDMVAGAIMIGMILSIPCGVMTHLFHDIRSKYYLGGASLWLCGLLAIVSAFAASLTLILTVFTLFYAWSRLNKGLNRLFAQSDAELKEEQEKREAESAAAKLLAGTVGGGEKPQIEKEST